MTTSEIDDTLHSLLFSDEKIVTYRYLSRKLKIHVNAAKEHLYSFHKKNEGKLHATYVVSGIYSVDEPSPSTAQSSTDEGDAKRDIYGFQMVPQESLDDEVKRFKRVSSVHVYSLGVAKSNDPQLLSDAYNGVKELECHATLNDLYKLGMVRNTILSEEMVNKPRESLKLPPSAVKAEPVKKPAAKQEISELQKTEVLTNTKGSLEAAFARSRKPAAKAAPAKRSTATSSSSAKKSKPVKAETKKQVEQKKKEMEQLQKMFEDESSDEEMPDVSEAIAKSEEQKAAAESQPPTEESQGGEEPESQDVEMKDASEVTTDSGRKKVRRKVKKTITKQTPDGYLETQVVEEFETASEDEKLPESKPKKATPAPKKTTTATKKGGKKKTAQASLMSFFGQ
ncbi:hypothetical protein TRVA0_017S01596 [Trichomonascus vanleenenianus]|uniref:uncharacterized protein n=1 Tax=Trichomonascus vanleenenianus TaxID=2268995 RepID=UPI003ECA0757